LVGQGQRNFVGEKDDVLIRRTTGLEQSERKVSQRSGHPTAPPNKLIFPQHCSPSHDCKDMINV
jgi:hypothetical protein